MLRRYAHRLRDARGQSLVEFALVLPVVALVMLMALDFGRVYLGWVNLQNSARIGANFAATNPEAWGSPGNATQQANFQTRIRNDAAAINCELPPSIPEPEFPDGTDLGGRARLEITCEFKLLTPLIGNLLPDPLPVTAFAVFPIRSGTVAGLPVGPGAPPAPPVANFSSSPSPATGPIPLTVQFTDTSTNAPSSWAWNFGDGNTSTQASPVHTYTTEGTYTVSLTVTNADGSDSITRTDYVTVEPPAPGAPSANFYGSSSTVGATGGGPGGVPINGGAPLVVTFTDTSTGSPTSWAWTFGDGGTSTLPSPQRTYSAPGTYNVTLTVTNAGGSNALTRTSYVVVGCEVPNFAGIRRNNAQALWASKGFTTSVLFGPGNGNWEIGSQSIPGGVVNPQPGGCGATITVFD
jgi:PKD repeat protein